MAKDDAYKEAEEKIPTMMEGLQDFLDFENRDNHDNPSWQSFHQENQG